MVGVAERFDIAVARHRAGDLEAAERGYRAILEECPDHIDALHMSGMVAYQRGDHARAIALIERAAGLGRPNASIYTNLGTVYTAAGRATDAIEVLRRAISIDPALALAYNSLGNACRSAGMKVEAEEAYRKAIELAPSLADAHANLGGLLYQAEHYDAARKSFQQAVAIDPSHASARHMLASLSGMATEGPPIEHVRQLFDEYSSHFEEHLVEELGYGMPALMRAKMDQIEGSDRVYGSVMDLGCGTGLAGLAFRSVAGHLEGVDVSARMVDKARSRGIYDVLAVGDICEYLRDSGRRYDLILCADVLPYVGDLAHLFGAVKERAGRGAYFVVSTEAASDGSYVLQKTGRYAHSRQYVEQVGRDAGFSLISAQEEHLRKQKGRWIAGDLIVLQYSGA